MHYAEVIAKSYLKLISDQLDILDGSDRELMVKAKDVLCSCYEALVDLEMEL